MLLTSPSLALGIQKEIGRVLRMPFMRRRMTSRLASDMPLSVSHHSLTRHSTMMVVPCELRANKNSVQPPSIPPARLPPPHNQQHKPIPTPLRSDSILPTPINGHAANKKQPRPGMLQTRLCRHNHDLRARTPSHLPPNPDPPPRPEHQVLYLLALDKRECL